jgi:hypothetical protein
LSSPVPSIITFSLPESQNTQGHLTSQALRNENLTTPSQTASSKEASDSPENDPLNSVIQIKPKQEPTGTDLKDSEREPSLMIYLQN